MNNIDLDKRDLEILSILLNNSRLSAREIARRLRLSTGTVQARIKRLEHIDIIKKYTVDLSMDNLGYQFPVLIDIKVLKGKMKDVEERLSEMSNVSAVYDITGEYDITVIARFLTRQDLDKFIKKLQGFEYIERTHTKLILNVIKENKREGYVEEIMSKIV